MVLAKPGSITPHTDFKGSVYVLSKEEGGRHTPFFNGYRPQFYFRTTDVTGSAKLPEGTEMCMPGDNIELTITLHTPVAMEKGLRFAIREGGRTVGAGTISADHQVKGSGNKGPGGLRVQKDEAASLGSLLLFANCDAFGVGAQRRDHLFA